MKHQEFLELEKNYKNLRPNWLGAWGSIVLRGLWTGIGITLSLQENTFLWFVGQVVLGFSMFHWFSVLHDCGHNAFFPSRVLNEITGWVASFFCFVPYASWKYVHLEHHRWTGWLDLDPSTRDLLTVNSIKKWLSKIAWRSWLPAFALAFLAGTFWNVKKLFSLFTQPMLRFEILANIAFIFLAHYFVSFYIDSWWHLFGVAFIIFGLVCEPIILSQHAHIPSGQSRSQPVSVVPLHEQDKFTRALVFPVWVSRYLTLSFENHIAHHFFPWIPSYYLYRVKTQTGGETPGFAWIRDARQIPGDVLVFEDRNTTGLKI